MIRVLVAEDSATSRALLVAVLTADPELEVVGEAEDGAAAVRLTRALAPDVVTMDVRMPVMDGYEATRQIMAQQPTPVVMVSSEDVGDVEAAMGALQVGALAAVAKPSAPTASDFERRARDLVEAVKAMATVRVVRQRIPGDGGAKAPARRPRRAVELVAIAASTGGPAALHSILSGLPADFAAPVLVVQHIASGFEKGFAEWLDGVSPLRVAVAEDGAVLSAGSVFVAPNGAHMETDGDRIRLSEAPPVEGFRPSGTALFKSVARSHGAKAAGLILTGMGRDGVAGLVDLAAAGGTVLAQNEQTCAIYGMPGAAVAAGAAHLVVDPGAMVDWLKEGAGAR